MKFIKNNIKGIIGLILGLMIAGGITAFATTYFATDIQYKNGKNVAQALNELYDASQLSTRINTLETQVANLQTSSSNYATKDELSELITDSGLKVKTGSWTGTGTGGSNNPVTINMGCNPKIVFLHGMWDSALSWDTYCIYGEEKSAACVYSSTANDGATGAFLWCTWGNNTLSFYSNQNTSHGGNQFNRKNFKYSWIALY